MRNLSHGVTGRFCFEVEQYSITEYMYRCCCALSRSICTDIAVLYHGVYVQILLSSITELSETLWSHIRLSTAGRTAQRVSASLISFKENVLNTVRDAA